MEFHKVLQGKATFLYINITYPNSNQQSERHHQQKRRRVHSFYRKNFPSVLFL